MNYPGEVASLQHEARDDTVERGALVVQLLAVRCRALFAGAQRPKLQTKKGGFHFDFAFEPRLRLLVRAGPRKEGAETHVLCSAGNNIIAQFECDASCFLASNTNVKKHASSFWGLRVRRAMSHVLV